MRARSLLTILVAAGLVAGCGDDGGASTNAAEILQLTESNQRLADEVQDLSDRLDAVESSLQPSDAESTEEEPVEASAPPTACALESIQSPEGFNGQFQMDLLDFPFPGPARIFTGDVEGRESLDDTYYTYSEGFSMLVYSHDCVVDDVIAHLRSIPAGGRWAIIGEEPAGQASRTFGSFTFEALGQYEEILEVHIHLYDPSGGDYLRASEAIGVQGPWVDVTLVSMAA